MKVIELPIAEIQVQKRMRRLDAGKVDALAGSIEAIGMLSPISVTEDHILVAGLHRLEAGKKLGWTKIPGFVFTGEALDVELAQIDENLIRTDLTVLEHSEHLARRKEIYEAQHPETRAGGAGKGRPKDRDPESGNLTVSFSDDTAKKTGRSRSVIAEEVQISRALSEEVKEQIRDTPVADSKVDLLALARMDPEKQKAAATRMIEGERPHVAQNTGYNEWYTPEEYIKAARKVMGGIDLDPASSKEANTVVKAKRIFTAEQDGLQQEWKGRVYMNPPYTAGLVSKFIDKMVESVSSNQVTEAVVLVNNATETSWFYQLIQIASAVCFLRGRVKFWQPSGQTGPPLQGQAVIYIGPNVKEFRVEFADLGWTVRL